MFGFLENLERLWAKFLFFLPGHQIPEDCNGKDILIVPGHEAGKAFYSRLKSNLDNLGFHVGILSTLRDPKSLEESVMYLAKQILTAPNEVTLIAHNTGGLVVLILPDEARRKVKRLITLGTPYHGSDKFNNTRFSFWGFRSDWVTKNYKNALFFPLFQPLSAIEDFSFPPQESTEFGQGRDLWFDIPGNYNLVRREENLRTLREFLGTPKDPILKTYAKASAEHAVPKKVEVVDFSKYEPANYKKNKKELIKASPKAKSSKKLAKKAKSKPQAKKKSLPAKKKKR
ncbi:MAG: alpha/beta hydrolase [Leptospira sp.]|nr:alpha/beta hydrolase [Leptospira sp.]